MNEPPDTPQPDKTIKVDRTAATGRQGNRLGKKAGDSSSHVSKSSLSGTSRLSFLTGILGTRTVNVSEMLNNDTEERDELRVQKRPPSEEDFADFESNFELKEKIADGGQGRINRAVDRKLCRVVALKSLHDKLKDQSNSRNAFLAEARITAQLDHPAIVPVHGIYSDSEHGLHLAMKLIKGSTLRRYLEKILSLYRLLPKSQVRWNERKLLPQRLDIFLRVCEAVSYAHHKKVIHRDLKPENIMIGSFNETYVMDWGISEHQARKNEARSNGKFSGTIQYIAPEVINLQHYDSRSDIYALGLILFETVFLKRAYPSETTEEALDKAQSCLVDSYEHFYKCPVDRDLKMIIRKALAPAPSDRYQNVKALAKDLRSYLRMEEVTANPDHFLGKLIRQFRHHYKLMLFFCMVLLLSLMSAFSYFLCDEMRSRAMQQDYDAALAEIYSQGIHSGSQFDYRLHSLESLLSAITWETALLLEGPMPDKSPGRIYSYLDGARKDTAPPGLAYAPTFGRNIDLDHFAYKEPPGGKTVSQDNILQKLYPLKWGFFRAVAKSVSEGNPVPASDTELKKVIATQMKPPFTWVYVSLKSGLHICYPYHSDYDPAYDPRERPWYRAAVQAKRHQAVWGTPYIDGVKNPELVITCSQAIIGKDGRLLGVAGADISLNWILDMLSKTGNMSPAVKNKYLIDEDGRVLVDSKGKVSPDQQGSIRQKQFHDPELLQTMWRRKNGRIFVRENGRQYLYFFVKIDTVRWLYVERIDFTKLLYAKKIRKKNTPREFL